MLNRLTEAARLIGLVVGLRYARLHHNLPVAAIEAWAHHLPYQTQLEHAIQLWVCKS